MDRCVRSSRMASQGLRTSKGIAARRPGRQPPCKWLPTGSESLHHRRWPSCRLWRTVEWAGALGVVVEVVPAAGAAAQTAAQEARGAARGGQGGAYRCRSPPGRRSAAVHPRSDSSRFGRCNGEARPPAAPPPVRASSTAAAVQWFVASHRRTAAEALPSAAPTPLLVVAMAMARRICISRC